MSNASNPEMIQRLVFIKYLHTLAKHQALQPDPLNAIAILMLHDAVELFLQLAAERHGDTKPDHRFLDYWNAIKDEEGNPPSQRRAMERLNRARVNLKHAGLRLAREDVSGLAAATSLFFDENTPTFFNTTFKDVSLHDLVTHPHAHEELNKAATARAANNPVDTVVHLALAFHWLIDDYLDARRANRKSPQGVRYNLEFLSRQAVREITKTAGATALPAFLKELTAMATDLHASQTILSLGINYRDFARFDRLTPAVTRTSSADPEHRYRVDIAFHLAEYPFTDEELDFDTLFVVTTGLTLMAGLNQNPGNT